MWMLNRDGLNGHRRTLVEYLKIWSYAGKKERICIGQKEDIHLVKKISPPSRRERREKL